MSTGKLLRRAVRRHRGRMIAGVLFAVLSNAWKTGARQVVWAIEYETHLLRLEIAQRVLDPRGHRTGLRSGELLSIATSDAEKAALVMRGLSVGAAACTGVDLRDLGEDRTRAQVALLSQEVHVFSGPLVEDVRLARPAATAREVEAALERVGALAWVRALPEGLDTVVGENGHQLTGAQAQQLAFARLVLADPPVAVLDDATAEAGSAGARELERASAAATAGRWTLRAAMAKLDRYVYA